MKHLSKNPNDVPFVSLIVPCRNEETYIERCLTSITEQNYPAEKREILVVDGMSEDATRSIVATFAKRHPEIRIINNPQKTVPYAMNHGIRESKGSVIIKMDAHSSYPPSYVSSCVRNLINLNADNVGGALTTKPANESSKARAIALSLSHVFGVGSSPFRKESASKKPREADTVAFGCYKRSVFEKIGLYNEHLAKSSDMEFNIRLKNAGGKIMLVPDIVASYYADATFKKFWKHNFVDGLWATYPLKFTPLLLRPRHFIPLAFVSTLFSLLLLSFLYKPLLAAFLLILGAYILASLAASLLVAIKEKNPLYFFLMPSAFAARHLAYGIGSLWGLMKLIFP